MEDANNMIRLSIPRNLRVVWPYPNLEHFSKYVDLLLLSASNDRVAYNRTYVRVPYGNVLLNYTFLAMRWHVSRNTCYSILDVLSAHGWLKIRSLKCRSISNVAMKCRFITFPKIGIEGRNIHLYESRSEHITIDESNNYEDLTHINGQSFTQNDEQTDERNGEHLIEHSGEHSGEHSNEHSETLVNSSESLSYRNRQKKERAKEEQRDEHSEIERDDTFIYIEEEELNKKEKYKKEKYQSVPTLDLINQFAINHDIVNFDLRGWFDYYNAEGWRDKDGRIIHNWQRLLIHAYRDSKSKFHFKNKSYVNNKPTTDDRLARQSAKLAEYYATAIGTEAD